MTLTQALRRTCELLDKSEDSDWAGVSAPEVRADLLKVAAAIESGAQYDRSNLKFLFAPTGPVQEIAMANGWGIEMLFLSEVVDSEPDRRNWRRVTIGALAAVVASILITLALVTVLAAGLLDH